MNWKWTFLLLLTLSCSGPQKISSELQRYPSNFSKPSNPWKLFIGELRNAYRNSYLEPIEVNFFINEFLSSRNNFEEIERLKTELNMRINRKTKKLASKKPVNELIKEIPNITSSNLSFGSEQFLAIIKKGDLPTIQKSNLITNNNINRPVSSSSISPFELALKYSRLEVVLFFIKIGGQTDSRLAKELSIQNPDKRVQGLFNKRDYSTFSSNDDCSYKVYGMSLWDRLKKKSKILTPQPDNWLSFLERMPTYNQKLGICYAYTAIQLVDHWRARKLSLAEKHLQNWKEIANLDPLKEIPPFKLSGPLWAAYLFTKGNKSEDSFLLSSGFFVKTMEMIETYGMCKKEVLLKNLKNFTPFDDYPEAELILKLYETYWGRVVQNKRNQSLDFFDRKEAFFERMTQFFPSQIIEKAYWAIEKFPFLSHYKRFLSNLFEGCEKDQNIYPYSKNLPPLKRIGPSDSWTHDFRYQKENIRRFLNNSNNGPLAFSYCSEVLRNRNYDHRKDPPKKNCGPHASIVIGKKKNCGKVPLSPKKYLG